MAYSVVTFAYNEEKSIANTLLSVINNSDNRLCHIAVIANGCTDNTAKVAAELLKQYAPCPYEVVDLTIGDKCNAWNEYLYNYLPDCSVHFYVDSDVTFSHNAFPTLFDKLNSSDRLAVTGLPQTGRNSKQYIKLATEYSCLFGNLYGVKHEFLQRVREQNIKLPRGLSWIDSQITKLINHDLSTDKLSYKHQVTFVEGVGYEFDSLKFWSAADIKLYLNRVTRYKVGQLQEPYLDLLPFTEWPEDMDLINQAILKAGVSYRALGKLAFLRGKIFKRLQKRTRI